MVGKRERKSETDARHRQIERQQRQNERKAPHPVKPKAQEAGHVILETSGSLD